MLPARRARLQAAQASVREALSAASPGRGRLFPRSVDTAAIDAAWPRAELPAGPLDALAAMVRARKTGRALPEQAAARAAVSRLLSQLGVREVRLSGVRFHLGEDHAVDVGADSFVVRSGALRVTLTKPVRGERKRGARGGVNLGRVRAALQEAAGGRGGDVVSLADYRARRTA